ncbi:IS5 family transposase [Parvularcula lutaonensis]|uniref:IS5 family transposase n=1 Tax=Parvularcula lutaonensis TaxID=491923 RepID=A0ABV7M806_9PROT|nr:IS5 family transposase [Parvularcula lutaonensis]GGY56149.1 IS5 family transposase [Parvularcula lutaonensis]
MPWNETTRRKYARKSARYASDLTDAEWALIEPDMPLPNKMGRPRKWPMREIMNALLYIASTGCQWRFLPKDFPPFSTVQKYFYWWRDARLLERLNHRLLLGHREAQGKCPQPTAGVIDSQSVKTTESGGMTGFDAGKKVKGHKRHILTDTEGFLVTALVHAADIQDRDGAPAVLAEARDRFPWLRHVFADGGYAGQELRRSLTKIGSWTVEIIKRSHTAKGFEILPRRWVVERTFASLGRSRRLAKDWERDWTSAIAWLFIAHIRIAIRRMARA